MKRIIILMSALFIFNNLLQSQEILNPQGNPVIDFINHEKIRIKAAEAVDRFQNPEKYTKKTYTQIGDNLLNTENEVLVSNLSLPESEIHSAINPKNPLNIVISPIKQNTGHPTSVVTCPVYYTFDGGATWKSSEFITKPFSQQVSLMGGGDPVFVFDADGNLYFSWINLYVTFNGQTPDSLRAALFWAKSADGGKTFNFSESNVFGGRVFSTRYSSNPNISQLLDKQWMAADHSDNQFRNSVYTSALFINQTNFLNPLQIHIYRKRANQNSFETTPALINTTGMSVVQFGSIDVDMNGNVHYTFFGSNGTTQSLYHCVSIDGGVNFTTPKKISNLIGSMRGFQNTESVPGVSAQRIYPSPYMCVDKSNTSTAGNIYITWSANGINSRLLNGMDIYFSKSTDGGKTWSQPLVVNNDGKIGVQNFYSNISVNDKGYIAITFYDRRNLPTEVFSQHLTDFFIAVSYDGGNTFYNQVLSSMPSRFDRIGISNNQFGIGEYNSVVMTSDYAYATWADGRTNNGNINVYFAKFKLDPDAHTSVEEVKSMSNQLYVDEIYPNPASDLVSINFFSEYFEKGSIQLLDMNGKTLFESGNINFEIGLNNYKINTSTLSSGSYIIKVSTNNIYTTKKIVISN